MLRLINYPLFRVVLFILLFLGLLAQFEGCKHLSKEGSFRVSRNNDFIVPVSSYTSGQTCNDPVLYLGNILIQVVYSFIIIFLLKMDEDTLRKRGQYVEEPPFDKEKVIEDFSINLFGSILNFLKLTILLFTFIFLFTLGKTYIPQYFDAVSLVIFVVVFVYLLLLDRNNPKFITYYIFHPSKFIKYSFLVFILLIIITLLMAQFYPGFVPLFKFK